MTQLALTDDTTPARHLTDRQRFVLDQLARAEGGLAADEVGALLCERRDRHSADVRCAYCATNGQGALRSKGLRGLVVRRRATGCYELTAAGIEMLRTLEGDADADERAASPSSGPAEEPASRGQREWTGSSEEGRTVRVGGAAPDYDPETHIGIPF